MMEQGSFKRKLLLIMAGIISITYSRILSHGIHFQGGLGMLNFRNPGETREWQGSGQWPAGRAGKISLYYLNMHTMAVRRETMMNGTKRLERLGVHSHRVAGFPIRYSEFIPTLQQTGQLFLDCAEHKARPNPDPAIVDLCVTEGFESFRLDMGMWRTLLPKGFKVLEGEEGRFLGALGCSISFLLAMRRAYLAGDDYIFVSEDDVTWDPLVAVVDANTALVRRKLNPAATHAEEALALVQGACECAANRTGGRKRYWENATGWESVTHQERAKIARAEAAIGSEKPVAIQVSTTGNRVYGNWRWFVNRQGKDCVSNRNACEFVLRDRFASFYGCQGVLWNRAAITYMVNLFFDTDSFPRGAAVLTFPSVLPPDCPGPETDVVLYTMPHPFVTTHLMVLPVAIIVPSLNEYSSIQQGTWKGRRISTDNALATIQGYARYTESNCNASVL